MASTNEGEMMNYSNPTPREKIQMEIRSREAMIRIPEHMLNKTGTSSDIQRKFLAEAKSRLAELA